MDNQKSRNSIADIVTAEKLQQIRRNLGIVRLSWPKTERESYYHYNSSDRHRAAKGSGETYSTVSDEEKVLLWYAENFRRQYRSIYPQRKPLVLALDNEYGVQVLCMYIYLIPHIHIT